MLKLIQNDPWLEPYAPAIEGRYNYYQLRLQTLTEYGSLTLADFADGHLYYGLHHTADGRWVFREWAPAAEALPERKRTTLSVSSSDCGPLTLKTVIAPVPGMVAGAIMVSSPRYLIYENC